MARPLRIEYPGAVYHVTARGNAREDIFLDDADRRQFLSLLSETVDERDWTCHAWCLMDNHYHLLVETAAANLGRGMRQINGVYTQRFNRAHGRVGHLFQGRYKAILVEKDAYLLELCRYVVLNPVRAGLVGRPQDWPWSSYRRTAGMRTARRFGPDPSSPAWLLHRFGAGEREAQTAYRRFVRAGTGATESPWERLRGGFVLGGDAFVERLREAATTAAPEIPKRQRTVARPSLTALRDGADERGEWMRAAHARHGYTLAEIAAEASLHYSSVSRIIKAWREKSESSKFKT